MTRINTIDPSVLLDEHLIAEWREMPRIVNELRKHPSRFVVADIPEQYTLNKGHVKFFRNKLIYLQKRHQRLCDEMDLRGINRNPDVRIEFEGLAQHIIDEAMNEWTPNDRDININIERIRERFELRKRAYHFKGTVVDSEDEWKEYVLRMAASGSDEFYDSEYPAHINCRCSYEFKWLVPASIKTLKNIVTKAFSSIVISSPYIGHRETAINIATLSEDIDNKDYIKLSEDIVGNRDDALIRVVEMIICMEADGFDVAVDEYGEDFLNLFVEIC